VEELRKTISKFKDEFIIIERLEQFIESKSKETLDEEDQEHLNALKDILKVYKKYEDYKIQNNLIDFGDMLTRIYQLLKSKPLILKKYQERFKYVLVDEFQDTNYIQLQIVNLVAAKNQNLTIVGDDDQSIYRFRGAYLTNIAEFKKTYPKHTEIFLEQNYRSTKNVLNVANKLISNKPDRVVKKLFTNNNDGDKVTVAELKNEEEQAHYILNEISTLLKKYQYKDIAILTRRKKDAQPLIDLFNKHKVPYEFIGNSDFFREPIIKDVLAYVRMAANPTESQVEIARILHRHAFNIKPVEIGRFCKYAHIHKIGYYEALEKLDDINVDKNKFNYVRDKIQQVVQEKTKLNLPEFIYKVLFEIDFYKHEVNLNNTKNIGLLNQFYKFATDYYNLHQKDELHNFVEFLEYASNFEIKNDVEGINNTLQVMTVHTAKGKEFPVVFIPDLVNGKLPTRFMRDKFDIPKELSDGIKDDTDDKELHIQEERRLFYVAITRAREKLYMTYALRYGDNKRDSKPSQYLEEVDYETNKNIEFLKPKTDPIAIKEDSIKEQIKHKYIKDVICDLHRCDFEKAIPKILLLEKVEGKDPSDLMKNLKELDYDDVLNQIKEGELKVEKEIETEPTFSVSQFNTYSRCPRIYKYNYVYRIPTPAKPYFDFGGTVHKVIEELTKKIKEGESVDLELALKYLDAYWKNEGYKTELEEKQAREEAKDVIKTFLEEQAKMKSKIVGIEHEFTIKLDKYSITGFIDRVDQDGEDYIILDYKTAKTPLSENALREDFQLLTYDMAVQQLFGKRPKKVGLWFLRSNKKVIIEPKDEDIAKIKEQILETIKNIMKEDFTPAPGWECNNCDYKLLCDAWKR
jgi:DNA helicase-2/ATP-dependent DNA helicase PcrA